MIEMIFASHNQNKTKEIQKKLPSHIVLKSLADIGWTEEIIEDGATLEENARIKAQAIVDKLGVPCFADDTGLEVKALNNEPGVYSARYAGPQKNDEDNMQLLLSNLEGKEDRSAQFRTSICLYINNEFHLFEGVVKGQILKEKVGNEGFGYDPIFQPEGHTRSFAQMSMEEKNELSHRGRAIQAMVEFLEIAD